MTTTKKKRISKEESDDMKIEEMANIMHKSERNPVECVQKCSECKWYSKKYACYYYVYAEALFRAGYHKE